MTPAVRHLAAELAAHGLLLTPERLEAAGAAVAEEGARLTRELIERCYPAAAVEFDGEGLAERVGAALAFGTVTARALGGDPEFACAVFNLGIGLVDGICDENAGAGLALLDALSAHDLAPRERGWLPRSDDDTVAFTVDVIETFFELRLPRGAGPQLRAALAAERASIERNRPPEQLLACSRATSVLPFEIIATLSGGDVRAATRLGEAMWRIDDLVDLDDDARSGALNGVLLANTPVEEAARAAAAGLRPARDHDAFLWFVQRYAGVDSAASITSSSAVSATGRSVRGGM